MLYGCPYMCVVVSAETLPSYCILMFWFTLVASGWIMGTSPQDSNNAQVRLDVAAKKRKENTVLVGQNGKQQKFILE